MDYAKETDAFSKGPSTARPPRTPGPVNDLKGAIERAATLCGRIEALADFLVGVAPEGNNGTDTMPADGLFNELADKAHYLEQRVSDAERALERIEKVAF